MGELWRNFSRIELVTATLPVWMETPIQITTRRRLNLKKVKFYDCMCHIPDNHTSLVAGASIRSTGAVLDVHIYKEN